MSGLAPRALGDSVRPRLLSGASVRPLTAAIAYEFCRGGS
jgi:hypothetical protein